MDKGKKKYSFWNLSIKIFSKEIIRYKVRNNFIIIIIMDIGIIVWSRFIMLRSKNNYNNKKIVIKIIIIM